ncbi:carbon-nitrogen hydrolase family protein [Alteromonas sediminis]|uniref:Carbon-nitrogen hydrolase family protein n=1 Tax=Alteromonas sediminis TaxID=2259342 RepID=A0A3N5XZ60_9ALTE|nr:carbon-nitrogen hydrolase family protein [Alteromonas sediminis]RPJ65316.1 carbon-nitrogen hydrolase family protein [Alteromonas sediminis]
MVNLVAVQMTSAPDVEENLAWLEQTLSQTKLLPESILVLPECFSFFGGRDKAQLALAESEVGEKVADKLKQLAQQYHCHIFAGTVPVKTQDPQRFSATCRCIDSKGEQVALYQKIHLFDVSVDDNTGSYRESASTLAGENVVVVTIDGVRVGVAVCYDVRFPGLFDAMGDIDVLVLPSAFTQKTGAAHWEMLIRARAIEKQCFVVAANQVGVHKNGRQTYGHSMIVSPWGDILSHITTQVGIIQVPVDIAKCEEIKQAMPVNQHRKFRSHFVQSS